MANESLRTKTDKELIDLLEESMRALHIASMKAAERQQKNVREIRSLRRTIARVQTEQHARRTEKRT